MRTIFILLFLSFIISISCDDELKTYPVGEDFVDSDISLKVIDTLSLKCGTFKIDSIVTSNTNRILIGSVIDNDLGHVTSQSYLKLQATSFDINASARFDSIGFLLNYDTYYYGDTTVTQTYKIHRVTKIIEPDEGVSLFNTSSFPFDDEILGELSFTPSPHRDTDSLYIPIKYELGKEIFDKIKDNEINNYDDFEQFFNGITIIPDTTLDSQVLGFQYSSTSLSENSGMRIYYTIDDDDSENNNYSLDLNVNPIQQFNHIESNRSTTQLKDLDSETNILSSLTNNLIYAQGGTGISARVEIPYLENLTKLAENSTSLAAELLFYPLKGSFNDNNPLQETLTVYVIDHKNRIVKELENGAILTNDENNEFSENTFYTVDLSLFIEEILNATNTLNYALMIQFPDYNKTVDRILIEDGNTDTFKMKLSVSYLTY
jgi:hypothetical protein